jgi:sigma-E factor negative regulatory protein RseA
MSRPRSPISEPLAADLSALADGEADAATAERCAAAFAHEPAARERWHAYQWIGDAMRSEALATEPARDAHFLAALRERLAAEPVVLAPAAAAAVAATAPIEAAKPRLGWRAPAAVAAGFVAVVGAVLVLGVPAGPDSAPAVAAVAPGGSPPARPVSSAAEAAPGAVAAVPVATAALPASATAADSLVLDDGLVRDARIDAYLRAHRAALGAAPAAAPWATIRRVDAVAPPR